MISSVILNILKPLSGFGNIRNLGYRKKFFLYTELRKWRILKIHAYDTEALISIILPMAGHTSASSLPLWQLSRSQRSTWSPVSLSAPVPELRPRGSLLFGSSARRLQIVVVAGVGLLFPLAPRPSQVRSTTRP